MTDSLDFERHTSGSASGSKPFIVCAAMFAVGATLFIAAAWVLLLAGQHCDSLSPSAPVSTLFAPTLHSANTRNDGDSNTPPSPLAPSLTQHTADGQSSDHSCYPASHAAMIAESTPFYQHIVVSPSPRATRPYDAARHFVSFGAGDFSPIRIRDEALALGLFDTLTIFNDTSSEWKALFPTHTAAKRGYGYWYWKSRIIQLVMERVAQPNDLVMYADGGCQLRRSYEWMEWFSAARQRDVLAFRLQHMEQKYTKHDVFAHFGLTPDDPLVGLTNQIHATFSLWRNSPGARRLLCMWHNITADFHLVSDEKSTAAAEHKDFADHRHDQSIISLLIKTELLAGNVDALVLEDTSYPSREVGQAVDAIRKHH